ncbi:MAG: HPr family phosphocarrier protein [Herbinix sp.]|nr:HPr family phosphocarrier protein [Herbinix sp.]
MKSFNYVLKDEEGLHARPARLLVKAAEKLQSVILIHKKDKSGNAKKIFAIMGLEVKHGEEITVTLEGETEELDYVALKGFFENNL